MDIKKEIRKQLRKEFHLIRPDITDAVVWFVSGGIKRETIEQVSDRILGKDKKKIRDPKERESIVYEVLLQLARESCQNSDLISRFREMISESVKEVRDTKGTRKTVLATVPAEPIMPAPARREELTSSVRGGLFVSKGSKKQSLEAASKSSVKKRGHDDEVAGNFLDRPRKR